MAIQDSPLLLKYKKQYEKNPKSVVFAPLAELYRKLGMIDKAMSILKDGIRYNPNYYMGYLVMASCYYDQSQFPMAYATLRPIVDSNRDNLRLQNLFAQISTELGYFDEALEAYKYILFLNPNDSHAALKVRELEERSTPVEAQIESKDIFDENKIDPIAEIDSWTQVDFGSRKPAVVEENWVSVPVDEVEIIEEKSELEAAKSISNEGIESIENTEAEKVSTLELTEETDQSEIPFFSYTLVDIYCLQQHFGKALEILRKMKTTNPSDPKLDEKILEVQEKLSLNNQTIKTEEDQLFTSIKKKMEDEKKPKNDLVIEKLNLFLEGIKDKKNEFSSY